MSEQIECYGCEKSFFKEKFKNGICPNCGTKSPYFIETKDEEECPVCHCYFEPGNKFCEYCGAKADAAFQPYWNIMETVYGPPPIDVALTCGFCGHHWISLEDEYEGGNHFCPMCGKKCENKT